MQPISVASAVMDPSALPQMVQRPVATSVTRRGRDGSGHEFFGGRDCIGERVPERKTRGNPRRKSAARSVRASRRNATRAEAGDSVLHAQNVDGFRLRGRMSALHQECSTESPGELASSRFPLLGAVQFFRGHTQQNRGLREIRRDQISQRKQLEEGGLGIRTQQSVAAGSNHDRVDHQRRSPPFVRSTNAAPGARHDLDDLARKKHSRFGGRNREVFEDRLQLRFHESGAYALQISNSHGVLRRHGRKDGRAKTAESVEGLQVRLDPRAATAVAARNRKANGRATGLHASFREPLAGPSSPLELRAQAHFCGRPPTSRRRTDDMHREPGVFRVRGGNPLSGRIRPQGNKNEALPLIAAACMTAEPVVLRNLPDIEDVSIMLEIVRRLGVSVERPDERDPTAVRLQAPQDLASDLPLDLVVRLRGAVTLAGPVLARTGRVFLPKPGGDRIGRRRLDTHILALRALGANVKTFPDGYELTCDRLKGADILLDEASVTGTENALCAAVVAEGETVIRNAASEPHVQGLCHLLVAMGAKIEGTGSNILRVQGVKQLRGAARRIGPDYLEVGSFISLAAVTGGELLIEEADLPNLRMIRLVFSRLGIETRVEGENLLVPADQDLHIEMDLGSAIPRIDDAPWPGFPADMTSVALVTATQCRGTVLIHEKMFESRLFFTDRLISMGAQIVLCDPHRALVVGPSPLQPAVVSSPDIRAGMAMLIATLCAQGESVIQNVVQIDRGFSRIDERLRALGADIQREES